MNLFGLRFALLPLLLFGQTQSRPAARFSHFRYRRTLTSTSSSAVSQPDAQACAILDADVFAHAASTLKDLRLYRSFEEVPYTITVVEPQQQDSDDVKILEPRAQHGHIVFDLEMPHRAYTGLSLDLTAHDFVGTATVSGRGDLTTKPLPTATSLGTFTLFDLTSQHLFHNTSVALPESTFPFLHIELALSAVSGNKSSSASLNLSSVVKSAIVPPSREAQSLYTAIQPASTMLQMGHESVATFRVPAKVPVERVLFTLPASYKGSFSRNVKIEARGIDPDVRQTPEDPGSGEGFSSEDAAGTILHIHKSVDSHDLSTEDLGVPVAIGSNMQQTASIEVRVENGAEGSLPLSVELQMRQRRICFDVTASDPSMMYYGDTSLGAPADGSAPMQNPTAPHLFKLGPETLNPAFAATPTPSRFVGQRPVLRWVALLGCVCIFALLVIRSTHKRGL